MADARSFDQWQKDVFFSAAEEVQESADALESVYRMWIRYRSDGFEQDISDELLRELRTALGIAKWQLEELARAVGLTHINYSVKDDTINRHRNFIAALRSQISFVEKSVSDSLVEDGKQPLRWVQLNEKERDDLAIFLSAAPRTTQEINGSARHVRTMPASVSGFKETATINKVSKYRIEVAAKEPLKDNVEVVAQEQFAEQKRTLSSPDMVAWKIVIADDQDANRKILETRSETPTRASCVRGSPKSVESMAKPKLIKNSFPKAKSGQHLPLKQRLSNYIDLKGITRIAQGINELNERSRNCFSGCNEDSKVSNGQNLVGRTSGLQRHIQGSKYYMRFGHSLRITILLLLTIVLIVPFVFYST